MSDFSPYKQHCVCGHDIASHFRSPDTGKREGCLGLGECGCKGYWDRLAPPPSAPPPAPDLDTLRCSDAPKVLAVGVHVRVTDFYSPHYLLEGSVAVVWVAPDGGLAARVEIDGFGEHWFPSGSLQVL